MRAGRDEINELEGKLHSVGVELRSDTGDGVADEGREMRAGLGNVNSLL